MENENHNLNDHNGLGGPTLIPLGDVKAVFEFSRIDFWRFRRRQGIKVITGRSVAVEEIALGFETKRKGDARNASPRKRRTES